MTNGQDSFTIEEIYWERIFLHIRIRTSYPEEAEFFFVCKETGKKAPLEFVDYRREKGRISFSVNVACVSQRSFLDNGRWMLVAKLKEEGGGFQDQMCGITPEAARKLETLCRVFRYAEDQMAYTVSFGVKSDDDRTLQLYMDSYFMFENRRWRTRRYVREVRRLQDKIKRVFMYGGILLIRSYYHVLYALVPKKGNRVMLMSETKDVLWGNLKYIDDRIKERGLDRRFKMTYSYRSAVGKHQSVKDLFSWMKVVTKIAAQDAIFVDDYVPVLGFFRLGKKTKLIQVWHAGEGFKSVGYSRFGKEGSPFPQGSCHKQYTHVITGSEHLVKVFQEVFAIEKEAFYPVGMPRLDGFLEEARMEEFKEAFYQEHPQLKGKKILLFAPTYRGAEQKLAYYDYDRLDLRRIYGFCKEKGWVFLIKMHPFVKKTMHIPEEYRDAIYDFSKHPNINELYYVTDLLVTDYSSNYFEYALLKRPVVFYTYDRKLYELTRGVHRSVKEHAPGKVCDTFEQLIGCLEKEDFEQEKILRFAEENFGDYGGQASDRVIDEILLKEDKTYG